MGDVIHLVPVPVICSRCGIWIDDELQAESNLEEPVWAICLACEEK